MEVLGHLGGVPIRKGVNPVKNANGERLPAGRTDPLVSRGFTGMKPNLTFSVAVKVVFPFLREELDGSLKALLMGHCRHHKVVVQRGVKNVGLPSKLGRRMGIGVGNQEIVVERGEAAIHIRVGGKACFQRMDMGCQVVETLLYGFKARFGPEKGKPGCPDVGGDEEGPVAHAKDHFEQIPGIEAQDRPAVGSNIPHPLQAFV